MIKSVKSINNNFLNIHSAQYHICEVPLNNLQGWRNYGSFIHDSRKLIEAAAQGLIHHAPELIKSGEGGAYLLREEHGNRLAVFKPFDEDPFSIRNPKTRNSLLSSSLPNSPLSSLMRPGESAQKEVAAYLLDRKNQAGVPLTTLVRMFGEARWGTEGKVGSLQSYVNHDHDAWELSSSLYSKSDVHSIALLDLRILNLDRHGGNVLVRRGPSPTKSASGETSTFDLKLIPIDHSFCLPDSNEQDDLWFEWMSWPQAKLSVDSRMRRYVREFNLEEDSAILRGLGLREEPIRTMLFCSLLLQQALLRDFSPLQVAEILCRRQLTEFVVENEDVVKAMRYRIEEILEQNGVSFSPPRRNPPLRLGNVKDLRERYRRQNSAPQLAGPLPLSVCDLLA